jgi:uncharacterized membrane protein YadS
MLTLSKQNNGVFMDVLMPVFVRLFITIGIFISFEIVFHDFGIGHELLRCILLISFFCTYFGLGAGIAIRTGTKSQATYHNNKCPPTYSVSKN